MSTGSDTFITTALLKSDVFSETVSGHTADQPDRKLTRRNLGDLPLWSRAIARRLAAREAKALAAVEGISGVPALIDANRDTLTRGWMEGTPLHLARPDTLEWFEDAARLLAEMHDRGVTHNDLAKPQNWLQRPNGKAAVIDFQLATVHRKRGRLYDLGVYEDRRHLVKQKKNFARDLLSPEERTMLKSRTGPSLLWRRTGKRAYNFVTRRLMNWSDGEGTGDRIQHEGDAIRQALTEAGAANVFLSPTPIPGGLGIYAFAESGAPLANRAGMTAADFLHTIPEFPRTDGRIREDALALVAANRLDEVDRLIEREPDLAPVLCHIVETRANMTDRYIKDRQKGALTE